MVCKMAGMALAGMAGMAVSLITWYIYHRLLHIGCPGNIIKSFRLSNIGVRYTNKGGVFCKQTLENAKGEIKKGQSREIA